MVIAWKISAQSEKMKFHLNRHQHDAVLAHQIYDRIFPTKPDTDSKNFLFFAKHNK
jgi:hypothetical protein